MGTNTLDFFFADARKAVNELELTETVYADDLNCFKKHDRSIPREQVRTGMNVCQKRLHEWGDANKVGFDPAKESKHVISYASPEGEDFKILGIRFDTKLIMECCTNDVVCACKWKVAQLLRCKRFYSQAKMVSLFKAQVLSYIEYKTPGLYHASTSILAGIDHILNSFLGELSLDHVSALHRYNLAPLQCRRDIAMLAVIHRSILGIRSPHLEKFFV